MRLNNIYIGSDDDYMTTEEMVDEIESMREYENEIMLKECADTHPSSVDIRSPYFVNSMIKGDFHIEKAIDVSNCEVIVMDDLIYITPFFKGFYNSQPDEPLITKFPLRLLINGYVNEVHDEDELDNLLDL